MLNERLSLPLGAVKETLTRENRLAEAFGKMLLPMVPDRMHKIGAMSEGLFTLSPSPYSSPFKGEE